MIIGGGHVAIARERRPRDEFMKGLRPMRYWSVRRARAAIEPSS
jgi:hypothetical protein